MGDNSQDVTIDNQQERLFFDIGYILGIIDGEGCCQFGYKYYYKGCKVFSPKITIFNSNPSIIEKTKKCLDRLGVSYYCFAVKAHGREVWPGWRVEIAGIGRVEKITNLLLPFPSGKQDRLRILNEFCHYRTGANRTKYSEIDQSYFIKLRELNKLYRGRTESPETIRSNATT